MALSATPFGGLRSRSDSDGRQKRKVELPLQLIRGEKKLVDVPLNVGLLKP